MCPKFYKPFDERKLQVNRERSATQRKMRPLLEKGEGSGSQAILKPGQQLHGQPTLSQNESLSQQNLSQSEATAPTRAFTKYMSTTQLGSPKFAPDPNKRMRLFSALPYDPARGAERIGRQVQVGNNFMIVYPSEKYPTREVLFNDSDHLRNAQLSQQSNSGKY